DDFKAGVNFNIDCTLHSVSYLSRIQWKKIILEKYNGHIVENDLKLCFNGEPLTINKKIEDDEFFECISKLGETWFNDIVTVFHNKGVIETDYKKGKYFSLLEHKYLAASYADYKIMEAEFKKAIDKFIISTINYKACFEWQFMCEHSMQECRVEEQLNDVVYSESYPYIENLNNYIDDYLNSNESVLLLIGQSGTGKTRLI